MPIPDEALTFVTGLRTITTAGDCDTQAGMAAHLALVTRSMENEYFFNADCEYLVVAQEGRLRFRTEFGVPDGYMPIGAITVGHRAEDAGTKGSARRGRRTVEEVVHRGSWGAPWGADDPA